MEFKEFDTYLGVVDNEFECSLNEFQGCFKECTNWLEELRAESEKGTAKSNFLLPKTPSAKRQRRRAPLEIVIEDEGESVSNACSPRRTRSTRSTRNTSTREQNLENIVPETNSIRNNRRTAAKNADRKIKTQVTQTLTKKLRQQSIEVLEESIKRASDQNIEEGQRPSKSRRLNDECTEFESMVPVVERLNSTVIKETDSQTLESSINVCAEEKSMIPLVEKLNTTVTKGKVSHTVTSVDVSAKMQLVPLVEKLNSDVHHTCMTSSSNTENQKQCDNQLSEHINNIHTSAVRNASCSSVETKVSPSECKPNKKSTERSHRLLRSKSSIENDRNSRNSLTSSLSDFTESNVTARDSLLEKDRKSFAVCENSKVNLSVKEAKNVANITITMEDKNKANLTFEIVPDENSCVPTVTDSVQGSVAKVGNETRRSSPRNSQVLKYIPESESANVEEPCEKKQSPILSKTKKVSRFGHNSTPDAKSTKPAEKKSAEVFSPYANEPVRERVAAFERLQCLSEESAESSALPEKPPVRITRTKTRAMAKAKAEAEAVAVSEEANSNNKELNENTAKNLYSKSVWKAARKSVAKAKKTSIKTQKEDKARDEFEMSKENSMVMSTSKYNTPICGMGRSTPLSSSNISNTNSTQRIVGFGSSTERFHVGNIVVGVESLITKTVKPTLEDIREMKEEEIRRRIEKEEEARRKREEALKEKIEERKRKREAKMQKVLKQREALEKQKLDFELRQQKEKEEKLKLTMQEREDKLKEQVMQKKQHAQQKAAEIEERRRQEEVARLAKLKEQEDEQLRLYAAKKKEQEELAKRQAEEKEAAALREQQAIKLYQMNVKLMKQKEEMKLKMLSKPGTLDKTFEIPKNGGKKKTDNYDDYGIDSSDCSDDEGVPTRPVMPWAKRENRLPVLKRHRYKYRQYFNRIFVCEQTTPDLKLMFSQYNIKQRKRTSSAVWKTPPCYSAFPKY